MENPAELVTVYQSPDDDAEFETGRIARLLNEQGLDAVICDESTPGVAMNTWEVRVPANQVARADDILATHPGADRFDPRELDTSHNLDLVTVSTVYTEAELVAEQAVLESEGIEAIVVGGSMMPNLPMEIRVPRADEERALRALAEAQNAPETETGDEPAG
jgi:hypothetical protein